MEVVFATGLIERAGDFYLYWWRRRQVMASVSRSAPVRDRLRYTRAVDWRVNRCIS